MISLLGEKVYIKLIEHDDLVKRVEWINDPEVQATLNYDYPTSFARTQKWFEKIVLDPTRRDFSIFTNIENNYIGFCGLINIDRTTSKAELYIVIGEKNYWKGGYGTDIYKLSVKYGFQELNLNRIYGYQLVKNIKAHKIVEKLGWKREGLLRQDLFSHGSIVDRYVVAILREDWEERQ